MTTAEVKDTHKLRCVKLWVDDPQVGCGTRSFLEVAVGMTYAHLLHVPTLTHLKLTLRDYERAMRSSHAGELPLRRGMISDIRDKVRMHKEHGFRMPGNFIREAIEKLREARRGDKEDERHAQEALQLDLYDVGDATVEGEYVENGGEPERIKVALPPHNEPATPKAKSAIVKAGKSEPKFIPVSDTHPLAQKLTTFAPKQTRGVVAKPDDPFAGRDFASLLAEAKKKGYKEIEAPNAGVRTMRVKNYLRNHAKKGGK